MPLPPRFSSPGFLIGGMMAWAAILISCVATNRTLITPPQVVTGATFVGSGECAECHDNIAHHFDSATHAMLVSHETNVQNIGCESCHGPGSVHVKTGGETGTILNPQRSPQVCFQCHLDKRGEFALPSRHLVVDGPMSCTDCHEPHRGDAVAGRGAQLESMNDTCVRCHAAQSGPFVFEHEAAREGCIVCHHPHGSVNDKLLRARNQTLCLQCHFQQQTAAGQLLIGGRDHTAFLGRGTCWTAGCHEAVHGSHVNSSLRF